MINTVGFTGAGQTGEPVVLRLLDANGRAMRFR